MNEGKKITKEALALVGPCHLLCVLGQVSLPLCPAQALSKMAGNSEIYFNCPVELLRVK